MKQIKNLNIMQTIQTKSKLQKANAKDVFSEGYLAYHCWNETTMKEVFSEVVLAKTPEEAKAFAEKHLSAEEVNVNFCNRKGEFYIATTPLLVSFEGYHKDSGIAKYHRGSLKQKLISIHEDHLYGLDEGVELTDKELIEKIDEVNGDGCDYIISIITSKGEVLYECSKKAE